ncbi:T9SS type A sorting domain-containing protein [Flavobacterium tyrosinilyticum]|uniref:T9SS type A sorting domain-containing protein n=1 Tax=Flavobacterium tyrosinilyticum TaxID=1658740 RepID=UPI0020309DA1|nr:T9SS type A sorting domain-containing protein [Flavobacterium tyrosinilyticum]MCM0666259.1 T9SS type A sorting domain-containing protein [Flavobacterium tyrosinilyticum]
MKKKLLLLSILFLTFQLRAQQEVYTSLTGSPKNVVKFKEKFYFTDANGVQAVELWESDGTASNNKLVKKIFEGTEDTASQIGLKESAAILKDKLYFIAQDEDSKGEIWRTDGTSEGTEKVTNFINGRAVRLTTVGDFIYFIIAEENDIKEVWKTDGSPIGTSFIKSIENTWQPSFQGKCNNVFVFTLPNPLKGTKVWRSDGTPQGTFALTEGLYGNGSGYNLIGNSYTGGTSFLSQYLEFNNKLYFSSANFLHETDGTLENTKIIANTGFGQNSVKYSDIIEEENNLYLQFYSDETNSLKICKYDILNKTFTEIYKNDTSQSFSPFILAKTNDSLLFGASNVNGGTSIMSLKFGDNTVNEIKQILKVTELDQPLWFVGGGTSYILKINTEEYFIGVAREEGIYTRGRGWILNTALNTLENIKALDNIFEPFVFNDILYYRKGTRLLKYSNNLGTDTIEFIPTINLYPNPSSDYIRVTTINNLPVENILVFDLNGRLVISKSNSNEINISHLSQGIYFAKISLDGKMINKKIIKN